MEQLLMVTGIFWPNPPIRPHSSRRIVKGKPWDSTKGAIARVKSTNSEYWQKP